MQRHHCFSVRPSHRNRAECTNKLGVLSEHWKVFCAITARPACWLVVGPFRQMNTATMLLPAYEIVIAHHGTFLSLAASCSTINLHILLSKEAAATTKIRYIAMALALRHDDALLALAGLLGRLITELCSVCVCVFVFGKRCALCRCPH